MKRRFAVRHKKRKTREEYYDKGEDIEQMVKEDTMSMSMPMDAHTISQSNKEDEKVAEDMPGIPIPVSSRKNQCGAIFVLENASLEVGYVKKRHQILNSDDHAKFLLKHNKDPSEFRPDIVHQALLMILDSSLNKAGRVRAVYVKTNKGVLIEVKPNVRIPRTYKRFAGIMTQLLVKLNISAEGKKIIRVIKNPVSKYLPLNSRKIGFSFSSEKLVDFQSYVADAPNDDVNFVFVVGAMAHGKIENDYVDDYISISDYSQSAAWCISRICEGLHRRWNVR